MSTPEQYTGEQHELLSFSRTRTDVLISRLLMLSFFLPEKMQVLTTMAAGLYFVLRTFTLKVPVPRGDYLWAVAFGSIYLIYLFSVPFTPQEYRAYLHLLCERKTSLLLLPVVFAIAAPQLRSAIILELRFFVYGCLISCFIGNADFLYHSWQNGTYFHSLSHVQYRIMFETCTGIHPTYMGMFLCFSVCITMLSTAFVGRRGEVARYAIIYTLLVFLLALLAKSPLIALVIIGAHYAWLRRRALLRYKMAILGLLASVAAACFFIPFIGQRLREVLQFAGVGKPGNVADNSVYVRKLLWNVDTDLLRQYWLTGVGPGRVLHMLRERYFFYSIANQFPVGYFDPHNQYFSEWLSFGVAGIVLFAAILILHFVRALRCKSYLYFYLLIIVSVTFATETVLSRQHGVIFYAVFTSLFFFNNRKGKEYGQQA